MDADCRIRRATAADLAAVAALERRVFPDAWPRDAFVPHLTDTFLLAEQDGALAGFLVARRVADEAEILDVAVAPECRRRGIGRALLRRSLDALGEDGVEVAHLEVRASNREAIGLYRTMGFREVGRRAGYYVSPREDAVLLARRIAAPKGDA
jgi:ribosomal-protein-alanine N-acetyltransferase